MLPPEHTLEDVKVRIKKAYSNPNLRTIAQAVLKDGPRAFRIATLLEVIDPSSGLFHHYSLKIDHIDRRKNGWFAKPAKSVRLEGKDPNEIERLYKFLQAVNENEFQEQSGELHIISGSEYRKLEHLLDLIPNIADSDKIHLAKNILSRIDGDSASLADFVAVFEDSDEKTLGSIAAASRMIEYRKSLDQLKTLAANPSTNESEFQKHLEMNPWMFGSEYSELLSRKTWTRDDRLDYMLRKTVDDYLEIVEIKTAFEEPLFRYDPSHDSYYPSSRLSSVLGQVARYIEEVERNRDSILAKDGVDTLKIRAKAIIGKDGSREHQAALRNFNAHLHRIEIITFDQLVRIAERVLSVFGVASEKQETAEFDLPF